MPAPTTRPFDVSVLGRTAEDLVRLGRGERAEALGDDLSRVFDLLEAIEAAYGLPPEVLRPALEHLRPVVKDPESALS